MDILIIGDRDATSARCSGAVDCDRSNHVSLTVCSISYSSLTPSMVGSSYDYSTVKSSSYPSEIELADVACLLTLSPSRPHSLESLVDPIPFDVVPMHPRHEPIAIDCER